MDLLNLTSESQSHTQEMVRVLFSWYDYALFGAMLLISASIGVYFGCFGKKQSTAKEYLLADKNMTAFPIAMSLVAANISGITLLSLPADVYSYGVTYWLCCIAVIISSLATYFIFLPVFYNLNITSTYEYFQLRFDTRIRLLASFLFTLQSFFYLPIIIYAPALALSQAVDLNVHFITPVVCGVCVFYTTLGGLKAVVWTDMLQFILTIVALIAVLYLGISSAGGLSNIFIKAYEGGRLDIDFDLAITKRDTFWAIFIGWSSSSIAYIGVSQHCVQKFLALPTFKEIKKTLIIFIGGVIIVKSVCITTGLIIYAKYFDCDPLKTKVVAKDDQLLPYYVMDVARNIPGLPGVFLSGVFCAALSTLSAILNCVSGTIYEDFISKYMPKDITQKTVSNILKLIVLILGMFSTAMVFVVQNLGNIFPMSFKLSGLSTGPIFGLFVLGVLFPQANAEGALCGGISSLVFLIYIFIGSQSYQADDIRKPTSTLGCHFNFTQKNITIVKADDVFFLFRISPYYYTISGGLVTIFIGLIVSYITRKEGHHVKKELLAPIMHRFVRTNKLSKKDEYYSIEKALHIMSNKDIILKERK